MLLALLVLSGPGLSGCGDRSIAGLDLVPDTERVAVDVVGVIHAPLTQSESFRAGHLLVGTQQPMEDSDFQRFLDARFPEAEVRESLSSSWFRIELPLGVSITQGAERMLAQTGVLEAGPDFLTSTSSVPVSLRATTPHLLVAADLPLVGLVASDEAVLKALALHSLVRIQGSVRAIDLPLDAGDRLQVEEIEVVGPHRIQLQGLVYLPPRNPDCVLVALEDDSLVELVGSKVEILRSLAWASGARIVATGIDEGLSLEACSGGPRFRLETFQLAKVE